MKTVVIYFSKPEVLGAPLSKQVFFEAYAELIEILAKRDVRAVIARADSYIGGGIFSSYDEWDKEAGEFKRVYSSVTADLIFNRDTDNTIPRITDCPILNHPDLDELCRDKVATFETFPDISGFTKVAHSFVHAKEYLDLIPSEKVVLKPRFGEQSHGVYVLEKSQLTRDLYDDWSDILVQEFLDSSDGIPDLVQGLHEVNVFTVNGAFAGARVKQPPEGEFISSATGAVVGKVWGLHKTQLPEGLWKAVQAVDQKLESYTPRLTRADFVRTTAGDYRLIELNSRPGLMHPSKEGKEFYMDFNGAIVEVIAEMLSNV